MSKVWCLMVVLGVAFFGCGPQVPTPELPAAPAEPEAAGLVANAAEATAEGEVAAAWLGKTWTLSHFSEGSAVQQTMPMTLLCGAENCGGTLDCNQLYCDVAMKDGELHISGCGTTKMACEPLAEPGRYGVDVVGVLREVRSAKVEAGQLVLSCPDGRALHFTGE